MKNTFFCLLLTLLIFSCNNTKKKQETNLKKPELSIAKKHEAYTSIENISKRNINTWKEYNSLNEFINRYHTISANEALNNALELAIIVKHLKDSIRPKALLTPSFRTRVNVLENEALRLKDMTYISAITAKEVNNQVTKILEAYSATNSKINTVYNLIKAEKEIRVNKTETLNLKPPKKKKIKQK
jgi:ABC-type ATPase with predicted acetyltransferase domain